MHTAGMPRLGSTFQEQAQAGKIKLVYHVKNFLDDNLRNDSSTRAANAAFCASDAGKFREFHNTIFPNQPANEGDGYTDAQLKGLTWALTPKRVRNPKREADQGGWYRSPIFLGGGVLTLTVLLNFVFG